MSCPTCGFAMREAASALYWCCRCGTLSYGGRFPEAPVLVHRCTDFEDHLRDDKEARSLLAVWRNAGIAEAIRRETTAPKETK